MGKEYDVIVVGGGPAGEAAGFAAARMGMKTLIIEQFNCLGGVAGAGGHGHRSPFSEAGTDVRIVGGIPFEVVQRVANTGYGIYDNSSAVFEVEGLKLVLEQMAEECGCELLYHTFCSEAVVEDDNVTGVIIQNKTGRQKIRAKRIIDCTGDGDVAASAGCGFDIGNPEGNCQPVTLMFTIGGVEKKKVDRFIKENVGRDPKGHYLSSVWKEAVKNGDMRPFHLKLSGWWWTPTRPDQIGVNFTHILYIDSRSAEDLTKATIEGRKQAYESIIVFRKYVSGMENCYMVSTPNTVGIRESRRIHGEYTLTREDVIGRGQFDDSIGYGSFKIDIHDTDGVLEDDRVWFPEKGFRYQFPYRIIVPKDVDNLLVAGRCVSCTHEALGSLRLMAQCGTLGQVAGVASVLSLRADVHPRDVNINDLHKELRKQGCIFDEDSIRAAAQYAKNERHNGCTLCP